MKTLVHGGCVLTLDPQQPVQEAMVIEAESVVATGLLQDMVQLAGPGAKRVDLKGATAMPGLVDAHPHFLHFAGILGMCVDILNAVNHEDIGNRIAKRVRETPVGEWIVTTPVGEPHYFIRRNWQHLAEGVLPDRRFLDAVAPDHPVMIAAWAPRIPNVCVLNTRALNLLGITRSLPDRVSDVWIEKDAKGEPTGRFRGSVTNYYNPDPFWLSTVISRLPRPTSTDWARGALLGQKIANSRGVTAAYEGHVMAPDHIQAYQDLRDHGNSSMRVMASLEAAQYAFDHGLELTEDAIRANFTLARQLRQTIDPLFRVDGLTLSRGGPCWPGFLRADREIKDPYGNKTRGFTFVPRHIEREAIEFCLANNVRLNIIQGAYQDHREFLESLEPYLKDHEVRSLDWVMQHNILIDAQTVRRYAELGFHFGPSMSFSWGKGDMYGERVGKDSWRDLVPLGRMVASGANVALGSDWGPARPFEHIALARTHEFAVSGHRNDQPGQPISRLQALMGWTQGGSRLMKWPEIGGLAPGQHADIAVVDRNPLTCELDELPGTRVLKTLLSGREVYDTGEVASFSEEDLPADRRSPDVDSFTRAAGGAAWRHICGVECNHCTR